MTAKWGGQKKSRINQWQIGLLILGVAIVLVIILGSTLRELSHSAPAKVVLGPRPSAKPLSQCEPAKVKFAAEGGMDFFFGKTKRFCGRFEYKKSDGEEAKKKAIKEAEKRALHVFDLRRNPPSGAIPYFGRECSKYYSAAIEDGNPGTAHTFWADYPLALQCPQSECKLDPKANTYCILKDGKQWAEPGRKLGYLDELSSLDLKVNSWEPTHEIEEGGHTLVERCAHFTGLLCECEQECMPTSPNPLPNRNRR